MVLGNQPLVGEDEGVAIGGLSGQAGANPVLLVDDVVVGPAQV